MNSELTAVQANQPLPEFLRRKPVAAALAIYAAEVICSVLLALAFRALFPRVQTEFVTLVGLSALVALALSVLG
ncbi:MAG TPA: hypothetical protein PJ988_15485, partial [Anaerolinea sp.]|nr:hypothetical protein [Anaerolinea sp.]